MTRKILGTIPWVAVLATAVGCGSGDDGTDTSRSEEDPPVAAGAPNETLPQFAPAQILIRFKENTPVSAVADVLLERGQAFSSLDAKGSIDALNATYRARRMKSVRPGEGRVAAIPAGRVTRAVADRAILKAADAVRSGSSNVQQRSAAPVYRLEFDDPNIDVETVAAEYAADPLVDYAGPNRVYYTQGQPSDPDYPKQWSHVATEAEAAWDVELGDSAVVVAVIDSGVDYDHEDLQARIWRDASGNPGRDFVDIDTAQWVEDGWTLLPEEDYEEVDGDPMDTHGHGTHCAGIIAAEHNSVGVAGVAPGVRIMPIRAGFTLQSGLGKTTAALTEDVIAASLYYAADNGASVISMSIGGAPSPLIKAGIDYAADRGAVLVAAAGNGGGSSRSYPAGYDNVISVASTGPTDTKASYSNFGPSVDIAAPGGEKPNPEAGPECIYSTVPGDYAYMCGTSMAAPYAAGLAALLLSQDPTASREEIRGRLMGTADPVEDDYRWLVGAGRVNARRALTEPRSSLVRVTRYALHELEGNNDSIPSAGEVAALDLSLENAWADAPNVDLYLTSSPEVTVRNPHWNVGDVAAFSAVDNSNQPFELELASSATRGQDVTLELTIVADGVVKEMRPITFTVGAANYGYIESVYNLSASGDHGAMVLFEEDRMAFNVFAIDLDTGDRIRITDDSTAGNIMDIFAAPTAVRISGPILVWQDDRQGLGTADIHSYDLRTGIETPLVVAPGQQTNPDVSGDLVVWSDTRDDSEGDIYVHDLSSGQETVLAKPGAQLAPDISGRIVVWRNESATGMELVARDLDTDQEWTIVSVPADVEIDTFKFSGDIVAYALVTGEDQSIRQTWVAERDGSNKRMIVDGQPHFDVYGSKVVYNIGGLTVYDAVTGTYDVAFAQSGAATNSAHPAMSGHRIIWQQTTALQDRILALTTWGSKLGDANEDGRIDYQDANDIASVYVGMSVSPFDEEAADANCDGTVHIIDALLVGQYVDGVIDYYPCELR